MSTATAEAPSAATSDPDAVEGDERRRFWVRLGAIVAAALAWRLAYVQLEAPMRFLSDEHWFVYEAHALFTGHPWTTYFFPVEPTALHGPLTSLLVAPFAWLFPHVNEGLRNVIAVLGSLTVGVLGLAGREAGGPRAGLVAAGIAAAFPDFWIRDGLVVSEPVAALFVALAALVALRAWRRFRTWHAVALGGIGGLVCLARPEAALAVVAIGLGVSAAHRGWRLGLRNAALVLVSMAVVLAPWFAYNQGRFKDTVLVSNNLGITLAGANCQRTYYDAVIMGYDSAKCWGRAYAHARTVSPDESVQSAVMRKEAQSFISHHLARLPLVMAMREAWFLGVYRPGWSVAVGVANGQTAWATWSQAIAFYAAFPAGMVLWWRNRRRRWPHWILGTLAACSFVVAALFVGHWRYRVTLDVGLVLMLALGFAGSSADRPRGSTDAPPEALAPRSGTPLG